VTGSAWKQLSQLLLLSHLFFQANSFAVSMVVSVASALTCISSRLDQLNSILYGTMFKHTARLRRIEHAEARVVLYQHSRTSPLSSSELLKQLHLLYYGMVYTV